VEYLPSSIDGETLDLLGKLTGGNDHLGDDARVGIIPCTKATIPCKHLEWRLPT
jgi:hypothetical protein